MNVMIVDDENDICFLLSIILIQKNMNPSYVNTLEEAKKTIDGVNPSILFLDNRLPDGYGLDYLLEVKRNHPLTKIVMITAHNSHQDQQCALQRGADYFISKPFSSETIKNTLDLLTA